ncbi:toll-like receptor 13 [Channa argus]|uniref:toll-like receptor 13 n=1 Tax=Channa argus TaxID=215402 RepID=UPI0029443312|nr:hypothetical protein Q8A73_000056 [Channa argus]
MGSLSLHILSLLLHLNPLLAYSLKNCTIEYSESLADVFVDCSERELVTVPDDIPRDVSSVKLSFNKISEINRNNFRNLSRLQILDLQFNWIANVDDRSFIHLGELTTLDMSSNYVSNLTAKLFEGLSNLTKLDLSRNYIGFIHPSAFHFLTSLQTVLLFDNWLRQITDIEPILQLPHLQELSISYNLFSSFETKDLRLNVSSGLKVLDVSLNKLKKFSITTPIFPQLKVIDLTRCGHTGGMTWDIPDRTLLKNLTQLYFGATLIPFEDIRKVLQNLSLLKHLRLNYMMKWINKGLLATVCKMPTLRRLDLSFNNNGSLGTKLVTCSQLTDLDLSYNVMTELSKGSILSMKRLRSLKLETNLLTRVPEDIRSLSSLEILNLSDNLISELGCEDFINTSLTELYLNSSHIAKLDSCVFENLNDLKVLDLSHNLLWTTGNAFKMGPKMLEVLDLSQGSLSVFDNGDFEGLSSLRYLNLVSNNIKKVHSKVFEGLHNLRTLIVSIPDGFKYNVTGLEQLENLTLYISPDSSFKSSHLNNSHPVTLNDFNSLKVFTAVFNSVQSSSSNMLMQMLPNMRQLEDFTAENIQINAWNSTFQYSPIKILAFRHTDLSHLHPLLFMSIPNLRVLDLSNCKLKSLDFLVQANLSALRYLKLTYNELTVINETVFQSFPALTYLDLDNNPFTCDCSNAGFIQWVKSNNQTQVVNAYQYTCSFPATAQGRKLMDFDIQSCWTDVGFLCFISSTCLVLLTLLSSFTYHFLRWQLAYGFYLFLAFVYDSRKKKKGAPHQYDAFVSYNVHDEAWVYREMLPVLEGEQGWRLCLHHRDFQPGKPIMENITDAIYGSRKTNCVISRRYLQSEWCSREIQMASFRLFDEQKDVLILLFLEDIPTQQLSPYYRMRKLVKRRTYLSWSQAGQHTGVFWQNVHRALETGDAPTDTDLLTGPAGC